MLYIILRHKINKQIKILQLISFLFLSNLRQFWNLLETNLSRILIKRATIHLNRYSFYKISMKNDEKCKREDFIITSPITVIMVNWKPIIVSSVEICDFYKASKYIKNNKKKMKAKRKENLTEFDIQAWSGWFGRA